MRRRICEEEEAWFGKWFGNEAESRKFIDGEKHELAGAGFEAKQRSFVGPRCSERRAGLWTAARTLHASWDSRARTQIAAVPAGVAGMSRSSAASAQEAEGARTPGESQAAAAASSSTAVAAETVAVAGDAAQEGDKPAVNAGSETARLGSGASSSSDTGRRRFADADVVLEQSRALARAMVRPQGWPLSEELRSEVGNLALDFAQLPQSIAEEVVLNLLEQSELPKTQVRDDLVSTTLELCEWFCLSGLGMEPSAVKEELRAANANKGGRCDRVWLNNHVAYRCRDCGTAESSCMCVECFDTSLHEGHDYRIYKSSSGGCCDCGDPNAWKPSGYCKRHGGQQQAQAQQQNKSLPAVVRAACQSVLRTLCMELIVAIADVLQVGALPVLSEAEGDRAALRKRVESRILGLRLVSAHGAQLLGGSQDLFVARRERLACRIVDLLVSLSELSEDLRDLVGNALLCSFTTHEVNALDTVIQFSVFLCPEMQENVGMLFLKLLIDPAFKVEYTRSFLSKYGGLLDNYLFGAERVRGCVAKFFDRTLCQLCNSTDQVEQLVSGQEDDMLGIIVDRVLQLAKLNSSPRGFETVPVSVPHDLQGHRGPGADPMQVPDELADAVVGEQPPLARSPRRGHDTSGGANKPRKLGHDGGFPPLGKGGMTSNPNHVVNCNPHIKERVYRLVMDLRLLAGHDKVMQEALTCRDDVLDKVLQTLSLLQEINLQTRKVGTHVLFESNVIWESAFLMELELAWTLFRLVDGYAMALVSFGPDDEEQKKVTCIRRVLGATTGTLVQWLGNQGLLIDRFANPGVLRQQSFKGPMHAAIAGSLIHVVSNPSYATSVHIPLHRFWAAMFHATIRNCKPSKAPICSAQEFLAMCRDPSALEDPVGEDLERWLGAPLPPGFACFVAEHPLRVLVKMAQVGARAWIRNGSTVSIEPAQYYSKTWSASSLDLDIFILQFAALSMDADSFMRVCARRFELGHVLDYSALFSDRLPASSATATSPGEDAGNLDSARKASRAERRARRQEREMLSADQLAHLCEFMLHFFGVLVHDRTKLGEEPIETMRKQVVHAIASSRDSKQTFSQIEAQVHAHLVEAHPLDAVLEQVAEFQAPEASSAEGHFVLKEHVWLDKIDIYFSHLTSEKRHFCEENFKAAYGRKRKRNQSLLSMRHPNNSHDCGNHHPEPGMSGTGTRSGSESRSEIHEMGRVRTEEPVLSPFRHLPFKILWNPELHGFIFRVLHACVRGPELEPVLARSSVLVEALGLLCQAVQLNGDLDIAASYNEELRLALRDNPHEVVGRRGNSCDGSIMWKWPREALQDAFTAPNDLRALASAINHRVDHVQRRISLPFLNAVLNVCEVVPFAIHDKPAPAPAPRDSSSAGSAATQTGAMEVGAACAETGSQETWAWPLPQDAGKLQDACSGSNGNDDSDGDDMVLDNDDSMDEDALTDTAKLPEAPFREPATGASAAPLPAPLCHFVPVAEEEQSVGLSMFLLLLQLEADSTWAEDILALVGQVKIDVIRIMNPLTPGLKTLAQVFAEQVDRSRSGIHAEQCSTPSVAPQDGTEATRRPITVLDGTAPGRMGGQMEIESGWELASEGFRSTEMGNKRKKKKKKKTRRKHDVDARAKRESKILEKFAKQQAAFLVSNAGSEGADAQATVTQQSQQSKDADSEGFEGRDCAFCREGLEGQPFGMVVFARAGSLSKAHELSQWNGSCPALHVGNREKHHFLPGDISGKPSGSQDMSVLVRGCGHFVHINCQERYVESLVVSPEVLKADCYVWEFKCPICRSLANMVLPHVPSEQAEDGVKAVPKDRGQVFSSVERFFDQVRFVVRHAQQASVPVDPRVARAGASFLSMPLTERDVTRLLVENSKLIACQLNDPGSQLGPGRVTLQLLFRLAAVFLTQGQWNSWGKNQAVLQKEDEEDVFCRDTAVDCFPELLKQVIEVWCRGGARGSSIAFARDSREFVKEALSEEVGRLVFLRGIAHGGGPLERSHPRSADVEAARDWRTSVDGRGDVADGALPGNLTVDDREVQPMEQDGVALPSPKIVKGSSLNELVEKVSQRFEAVASAPGVCTLLKNWARQALCWPHSAFVHVGFGKGKSTSSSTCRASGEAASPTDDVETTLSPSKDGIMSLCRYHVQLLMLCLEAMNVPGASAHASLPALELDMVHLLETAGFGLEVNLSRVSATVTTLVKRMELRVHAARMSGLKAEAAALSVADCVPCVVSSHKMVLPSLLALPNLFTSLYLQFCDSQDESLLCDGCGTHISAERAMICLACGQTLCTQDSCLTSDILEVLFRHAAGCHRLVLQGVSAFMPAAMSTVYITIDHSHMLKFGCVYLDAHGEEDPNLRRGKPLFLSSPRATRLHRLAFGMQFVNDPVSLVRVLARSPTHPRLVHQGHAARQVLHGHQQQQGQAPQGEAEQQEAVADPQAPSGDVAVQHEHEQQQQQEDQQQQRDQEEAELEDEDRIHY